MKQLTEFYEARKTSESNANPIMTITPQLSAYLDSWKRFISMNTEVVNYIVSQGSMEDAKTIADTWFEEVIKLGKTYYGVDETTDQIYNNYPMLMNDLELGLLSRLERTYITTFTNVAKYQKRADNDVV